MRRACSRRQALSGARDDQRRTASPTSTSVMPALERMAAIGMPLLRPRRGDRPRRRHLRPRGGVHRPRARRRCAPTSRAEDRARAYHHRGGGRLRRRRRPATSPRRSRRIIWSSTATRSSPAASGRISIACRSPSASGTGWRCAGPRPRAARILPRHRQRAARRRRPRRPPAAAPASSTRRSRSRSMPQVFEEEGALDRLEAFASLNGPASTACRSTRTRITLAARGWTVPERVGEGELAVMPFRGRRDAALAACRRDAP